MYTDNIRALLNKERSLAKALGEETLAVDENKIPSTATVRRVEERVEELGLIFEEREEAMFAIKEEVVHLLDVLDLDLNATSVEEMFIVNQEQFESLQPQDMESVRQTLGNLRRKVEVKKQEVSHYFLQRGSVLKLLYCQHYPAIRDVKQIHSRSGKRMAIHCLDSERIGKYAPLGTQIASGGRIFQYIPPFGSVQHIVMIFKCPIFLNWWIL